MAIAIACFYILDPTPLGSTGDVFKRGGTTE